jgi:PAS domain S-box-containing protein
MDKNTIFMTAPRQSHTLRNRIFFSFLAALLPVVVFCTTAIELYLIPAISANARQELQNTTLMLKSAVQTAADVAVRTHLKAIAEKNAEIVSHLLSRVAAGELDFEEAKIRAREILLAQQIGSSGYIYCLDSHGTAVVHPNPEVENTDNSRFAFVREQMARKQGYIEYEWQNPGEEGARAKALYMVYVPGLDWIISVSSYRAEFMELIDIGDFKNLVLSPRFGASGYAYVVNQQGDTLIHPLLSDYNALRQSDLPTTFLRTMIDSGSGTIEYRWRNPGESAVSDKIAVYESIAEYGWVIVSASYKSEILRPATTARKVAYGATALLCLTVALASYLLSGRLTRPVTAMIAQLDRNTRQLRHEPLPVHGDDELGRLAGEFNNFLATIEANNDELERQKDRYLGLFETSPDALILLRGDILIDCNPATLSIFSGEKEEIIGKTVVDLSPPEQHGGRSSADLAVQLIGEAQPGGLQTFEWQHRALNGRLFDAEVQLKRFGEDAGEALLVAFIHDITERKRAEEQLQKSEEQFRNLYDEAPVGYFEYDLQGNITRVNHTYLKMLGYSAEEMLGQPCWKFIVDEVAREQILAKLDGVRPPGVGLERTYQRQDGSTFPVLFEDRLLLDEDGHIKGIRTAIQDITGRKQDEAEREKLQAQLTQAQKIESVGRLAGGVAHDFNNMLGVILGHTEMALTQIDPAAPLYSSLQAVQQAAQRSADLTRQLLAFARKQTVAPKVIDINHAVEGMLAMLTRLIGEDIQLFWQPGRNLQPIKADPSQIDQLLANLCVNARDAIAGVGRITIETDAKTFDQAYCADHPGFLPGEYLLLEVSDDGSGMDQNTLSHIFEPFFTTKEQGKGTGLGLASVFGMVKQNNGFINVYSEPGQGTTFKIYLPVYTAKSDEVVEKEPELPDEHGSETILLVEDEPAILQMTTMMLARLGYTVVAAATPGEAIRLAHEYLGRIDMLMTDVVMPEMNGRELAGNLLSHYPDLKRLFMSGYTANVIAHHGVLDEGVHFIQKPFSMKDLAGKMREALEG